MASTHSVTCEPTRYYRPSEEKRLATGPWKKGREIDGRYRGGKQKKCEIEQKKKKKKKDGLGIQGPSPGGGKEGEKRVHPKETGYGNYFGKAEKRGSKFSWEGKKKKEQRVIAISPKKKMAIRNLPTPLLWKPKRERKKRGQTRKKREKLVAARKRSLAT